MPAESPTGRAGRVAAFYDHGMGGCPQCQRPGPHGARFCSWCGSPLAPTTPREERKRVSVLFCDLVGFTSRSESLDVEDVRGFLTPYYAHARAALERYGGTVEKFIGDAVVAVFGAPLAREDDAERAVRAGLAIQDAMAELNAADERLDLHVRVGVTTGPALVSLHSHVREGEGLVVGDVVNTAARLQALAPVDGILVDQLTRQLTSRVVDYHPSTPYEARGRTAVVAASVVIGLRAGPPDGVSERGETPLVGREAELALLTRSLDEVERDRRVKLVVLLGHPGLGKSRLVEELRRRVHADSHLRQWQQSRCLPYGDRAPLWALSEIVRAHAGIQDSDSVAQAQERLRATTAMSTLEAAEADWVASNLAVLAGIGDGGSASSGEAFAAWRRYLEAMASERPTILVIEDLHWSDTLLLDFLDHVVTYAARVPLLLVTTARPELLSRRPAWRDDDPARAVVPVEPLTSAQTARLIALLLGANILPVEVQTELLDRAGGNPLYAEEWVRLLADHGRLRRTAGGHWAIDPAMARPSLPPSVEGVIAARLDTLDADHKDLLHAAAVLGLQGWVGGLGAIASLEPPLVEERFAELDRRGLLHRESESAVVGDVQYAFQHALVREVAYSQIPRAVLGDRHQRSARWIAGLAPDRLQDRIELLAHHWKAACEVATRTRTLTAELSETTRFAMREAGERAKRLHAYEVAASWYADALALWPDADRDRPHLLLRLGTALGQSESGGVDALVEAYDGLVEQGELELAAAASRQRASIEFAHGQDQEGTASLRRALSLLVSRGPSLEKASVLADLAMDHMIAGRSDEAVTTGRYAIDMADALDLAHPAARSAAWTAVGVTRLEGGDPAGLGDLQQALDACLAARYPPVVEYHNLANAVIAMGDLNRGFELNAEAQTSARTYGMATDLRLAQSEQIWESYWRGRWKVAADLADRAIARSEAGDAHFTDGSSRHVRGLVRLARGDAERSLTDLSVAVDLASQSPADPARAPRLAHYACALLAGGRRAAAGRAADQVLATITSGARLASPDWSGPLATALDGLDRLGELDQVWAHVGCRTQWFDAAVAMAAGDFDTAADVYAVIGSRPDEALARLRAGQQHLLAGRLHRAESELGRAAAFWRSVGARHYLGMLDQRRAELA